MQNANLQKIQSYFFFSLLLLIGLLAFLVLLPYVGAIVLASVFAIIFHPFYRKMCHWVGGQKGLGAFLTMAIVFTIVLIPLVFLGMEVFNEARGLYLMVSTTGVDVFLENLLPSEFFERLSSLSLDLNDEVGRVFEKAVGGLGSFFVGTVSFFINLFLFLMIFYYLLKDGDRLKKWVVSLSPLPDAYDDDIMISLKHTVNSVIRGSLVMALIQGFIAGVGYWIFGVPNPAFWGSVTAISAVIPGVGTSIVVVPAIIYLFVVGSTAPAIGLLIWGAVAVGLIDNFLRPYLIHRDTHLHPLLVLMSVLGGISLFGPLGFLIGPLVFSLFLALVNIYSKLVSGEKITPS